MNELDYYYSALFAHSNRIEYVRYILLFCTIISLSLSIYLEGYYLYAAAFSSFLFQVISWYLKTRVDNIRYLGNEFQKNSMLYQAYGRVPSKFQISHLIAQVSKFISLEVENKRKNQESIAKFTLKISDSERSTLLSMIHENSYWNHHLYRALFTLLVGSLITALAVVVISALFFLPLVSNDPEYTVPRLAFTFMSFSVVYEVIEKTLKSYSASKIMLEIDNELSRMKNQVPEDYLLKVFNQYCNVKSGAPNIPSFLYKSSRDKLNSGWFSRVQMSKFSKNA